MVVPTKARSATNALPQCIQGAPLLLKVLHGPGFTEAYPMAVGVTICNEVIQSIQSRTARLRSQLSVILRTPVARRAL